MRLRLLAILFITLAMGLPAKADSVFDYSIGIDLQNTCTPGQTVSINAVLMNTGSTAIAFAPSFPGGSPTNQGGSVPFGGVSGDGQWNVLSNNFSSSDFLSQFAGITIAPGQAFSFTFGTFIAPTVQALGTSATPQLNLGIDFTDLIEGNLLGICPEDCTFHNTPAPTFTLGNTASSTDMTYFQAVVVDRNPVPVPEPSTWEMIGLAMMTAIPICRRQLKKSPLKLNEESAPPLSRFMRQGGAFCLLFGKWKFLRNSASFHVLRLEVPREYLKVPLDFCGG